VTRVVLHMLGALLFAALLAGAQALSDYTDHQEVSNDHHHPAAP